MFKVWVEIEEIDDNGDTVAETDELGILPDCLGSFETLRKAAERQGEVVDTFGIDPENSDAVRIAMQEAVKYDGYDN